MLEDTSINPESMEEVSEKDISLENNEEERLDLNHSSVEESENISQDQVEILKKEISKNIDQIKRVQAEFDNYRKRIVKEKSEWKRIALADFLLEILDVVDNFDRALQSIPEDQHDSPLYEGFKLIDQQFHAILNRQGVEKINAMGTEFDPQVHEAVFSDFSPEIEENYVINEISAGFFHEGKLLRPSKVTVSLGPKEDKGSEETSS